MFKRLLVVAALVLPSGLRAQNLIVNGGNENPLVSGSIPFWTQVAGTNWTQRSLDPLPFEGSFYFFAGVGAFAELAQNVDVSSYSAAIDAGAQQFSFSGYVRSFPQSPPDASRIILDFLGANNSVLRSFNSGAFSNVNAWQAITNVQLAPISTRTIRVRLQATRNAGENNDGYFDALDLRTATVPEPSTYALMAAGLLVIGVLRGTRGRRRA